MEAVSRGRAELGEEASVPRGATCRVAPGGEVTLIDPVAQRRYVVRKAAPAAPSRSDAPSAAEGLESKGAEAQHPSAQNAASPSSTSSDVTETQTARDSAPRRISLPSPADLNRAPRTARAARPVEPMPSSPRPERPPRPRADVGRTVAFEARPVPPPESPPPSAPPQEAPSPPDAPGSPSPSASPEVARPSAPAPSIRGWRLLSKRDRDPSEDNPLRYRERIYVVPEGSEAAAVERFLRERFQEVRATLEGGAPGRFVNLVAFDHAWTGRPSRPPLLILQWKDWRGAPVLQKPTQPPADAPSTSAPKASAPPPKSAPSAPLPPATSPPASASSSDPSSSYEGANPLATAFEACQDLLFLQTPSEGVDFVVRLLAELIPAKAIAGALYDINDDVWRIVAAQGLEADSRKGHAVPAKKGLLGVAASMPGSVLRIDDVPGDGRFEPGGEAPEGLHPTNALYMAFEHRGALLGALQLLDRSGEGRFTEDDEAVLRYVGQQLARFLSVARARTEAHG